MTLRVRTNREMRPWRRRAVNGPHQSLKRRHVEGGDHGFAVPPRQTRREAVQAVVVDHVETAVSQWLEDPCEGLVQCFVHPVRPVPIMPWQVRIVVPVDRGMQPSGRLAVTGCKQRHIMAATVKRPNQMPAMRLHAPHEGAGDRVTDMTDHRDPQGACALVHSAATRVRSVCARTTSAVRSGPNRSSPVIFWRRSITRRVAA